VEQIFVKIIIIKCFLSKTSYIFFITTKLAIIKAILIIPIIHFEKLPKNDFSWSASFESGKHCAKLFNSTYIDENAFGYIYALDKKYFTNTESIGGIQYICKHSLKPKQIYKVYYKDFKDYFKNINK